MSENGLEILFFIYNILSSLFGLTDLFFWRVGLLSASTQTQCSPLPRVGYSLPHSLHLCSPPSLPERPSALNFLPPLFVQLHLTTNLYQAALESAGSSRTFFSVDFRIRSEFSSIAYFILWRKDVKIYFQVDQLEVLQFVFFFFFSPLSPIHTFTFFYILIDSKTRICVR